MGPVIIRGCAKLTEGKERALDHYNREAKKYLEIYRKGYREYPANRIRLNIIVSRLKKNRVRTILDAGCGSCGPMIRLLREGYEVTGFDFSSEMVKEGKRELIKAGFDPRLVFQGDLEVASDLPDKKYDAMLALGVFPHIVNENTALDNIRRRLERKGMVFIEFRNELFAAYTMNKYSLNFFLNRVVDIQSLPKNVTGDIARFYGDRMQGHSTIFNNGSPKVRHGDMLAKFHNPLTVEKELFKPNGFAVKGLHFYHYHAMPPIFEKKYPRIFRRLSLKMERPDDWRGYLMASAYTVEAQKI